MLLILKFLKLFIKHIAYSFFFIIFAALNLKLFFMVTFDFYNKRSHRMETTSLQDDVFKKVISDCRKCGISTGVYNVR